MQRSTPRHSFRNSGRLAILGLLLASPQANAEGQNRPSDAAPCSCAPSKTSSSRDVAIGFQLDLFPTIISAVNGRVGYAPQVWLGVKPVRVRLIAAHLEPPDALAFNKNVVAPKLTALSTTIDYTFGDNFDGAWLGAGVEAWMQQASAADGSGQAQWTSGVFTLGGGYIIRFAGNFFVDPWVGAHWILNAETHQLGSVAYEPPPLEASASVKIGWFYWAR